jgi:hypothetical protein
MILIIQLLLSIFYDIFYINYYRKLRNLSPLLNSGLFASVSAQNLKTPRGLKIGTTRYYLTNITPLHM